jgi:hypothetical protein
MANPFWQALWQARRQDLRRDLRRTWSRLFPAAARNRRDEHEAEIIARAWTHLMAMKNARRGRKTW